MSIYACSDLHGQYELWKQIKNYLQKDDKLIYLGDAIDRGPDGLEIVKELLNDYRFTYLKGNHEDMFIKAYPFIKKDNIHESQELYIWYSNGGIETRKHMYKYAENELKKIYWDLYNLPVICQYKNTKGQNLILTHAGMADSWLPYISDLEANPGIIPYLIWDRAHLFEPISEDYICIHGHTPVQALNRFNIEIKTEKIPQVVKYANNTKIDIDLGSFESGIAALLNLDTLEPIYFTEKKIKGEIRNE